MVVRISELKLPPGHKKTELEAEICRILRISPKKGESHVTVPQYEVIRRSIDARKKPELFFVYTIDVHLPHPQSVVKKLKNKHVTAVEPAVYTFPFSVSDESQKRSFMGKGFTDRPVIVGSGPSGLFCALMLARAGLCPVVLERGEDVEKRTINVQHFWETGELNPSSNVQFGEGGAGTFSDGKLNTLIKDPEGKIRFVLREFVKAGADPSILWNQKPHIGTDVLTHVVKQIREEIISLGGEFRFETCVTGISEQDGSSIHQSNAEQYWSLPNHFQNKRYILELNHGADTLLASQVVLAIGHSARDTFQWLNTMGVAMEEKAFAVGLRVEHSQDMINLAMYGNGAITGLGAASYKLTHKCQNGRGVYSFCMCPGGYVVNASSEPGMTSVNGMSYSARDGKNANSAIVVTVTPEDYRHFSEPRPLIHEKSFIPMAEKNTEITANPLSGIQFQQMLESAAFQCSNGHIPVQRFEDFCDMSPETTGDENRGNSHTSGILLPQNKGLWEKANVRSILPEELNLSIIEGMHAFGQIIPGFDGPDVLLSGVESRTSSPIRILRNANCQSITHPGLFPCGEGAGYAGGITSAAVDGIRIAEAIVRQRLAL